MLLKWAKKTEITDQAVEDAAKGVVMFDMKETGYMLKLSATAWKTDIVNLDDTRITRLFI